MAGTAYTLSAPPGIVGQRRAWKNVFMRLSRVGTKINQHILIIKESFSPFNIVLLLNRIVILYTTVI